MLLLEKRTHVYLYLYADIFVYMYIGMYMSMCTGVCMFLCRNVFIVARKGSLCDGLEKRYGLVHVSPGQLLREEVAGLLLGS